MKKLFLYVAAALSMAAFLVSCSDDNNENNGNVRVVTTAITEITATSAETGGQITSGSEEVVTFRGICWSTTENPTLADNKTENGSGDGTFTATITGLTPVSTYYVRAYAVTDDGTTYGNQLSFTTTESAPNLEPVKSTIGKLNVSVDPRNELLTAIQLIIQYPYIGTTSTYSNEVKDYFSPFTDSKATYYTYVLANDYGFGFDAPHQMILHFTNPPELDLKADYTDYLIRRAGSTENLDGYRMAMKAFAEESNFTRFWNEHTDLYDIIVDKSVSSISDAGVDFVKTLEDYYGDTQNSYNLIINPLTNNMNYGSYQPAGNGKTDAYAFVCTAAGDLPYVTQSLAQYMIWHEFGHCFVNPICDENESTISGYEDLYEPIRDAMMQQAYSTWMICIYEHVIRAVVIRLYELHIGSEAAQERLEYELYQRFIYAPKMIEKLKVYEQEREKTGITFAEYFPEFLKVLEEIQTEGA